MSISRSRKRYVVYPKDYTPHGIHKPVTATSRIKAKKACEKFGAGSTVWTQRLSESDGVIHFWNFDLDHFEFQPVLKKEGPDNVC